MQATRTQLLQHLIALQYITKDELLTRDLTVDDVLETHRIMMNNSMEKDGTLVHAGVFRSHNVRADNHVYSDGIPLELRISCSNIINRFNSSIASGLCIVETSSKLFYDLITLHPFSNGNGRLCRLLVAYAIKRGGFPFTVPLTLHHRKSRNHYMKAILQGRQQNKLTQMNSLILVSMHYAMRNYQENMRLKCMTVL